MFQNFFGKWKCNIVGTVRGTHQIHKKSLQKYVHIKVGIWKQAPTPTIEVEEVVPVEGLLQELVDGGHLLTLQFPLD